MTVSGVHLLASDSCLIAKWLALLWRTKGVASLVFVCLNYMYNRHRTDRGVEKGERRTEWDGGEEGSGESHRQQSGLL